MIINSYIGLQIYPRLPVLPARPLALVAPSAAAAAGDAPSCATYKARDPARRALAVRRHASPPARRAGPQAPGGRRKTPPRLDKPPPG